MRHLSIAACFFHALFGYAQVYLPPITINVPSTSKDHPSPQKIHAHSMGTFISDHTETEISYLGTHWSNRFTTSEIMGYPSDWISLPIFDLGLFDLSFFPDFSEDLLASRIHFNLSSKPSDPFLTEFRTQVGSDISEYTYYLQDYALSKNRLRLQLSQKFSAENLRYYDDLQSFFTPADDVIRIDPTQGHHRLQGSLSFHAHDHELNALYVFKHENVVPYPLHSSLAHQDRQLILINAHLKHPPCSFLDTPCQGGITGVLYQSWLLDPHRDLFLGIDQQRLTHRSLMGFLESTPSLSENIFLTPRLILQGEGNQLQTTDLTGKIEIIPHTRFQLGGNLGVHLMLLPLEFLTQPEFRGVYDVVNHSSILENVLHISQEVRYHWISDHSTWLGGTYAQELPSFFEKFGSFGTIRGNPNLKKETHGSFFLGSEHVLSGTTVSVKLHGLLHYTRYSNLIHFVPNAQFIHIPQNIGSAQSIGGAFLTTIDAFSLFKTHLKINWLKPQEILMDRVVALPGVAAFHLFLQETFSISPIFSTWVSGQMHSGLTFDRQGNMPFPQSWVFHTGVEWNIQNSPIMLRLDINNIFDQMSGTVDWHQITGKVTLPVLKRWGYPQRGRVIFLSFSLIPSRVPTKVGTRDSITDKSDSQSE